MMICPSCGRETTTVGCLNWECPSKRPTPGAFESPVTLLPPTLPKDERIKELEDALAMYGKHQPGCNVSREDTIPVRLGHQHIRMCNCGLSEVLRKKTTI